MATMYTHVKIIKLMLSLHHCMLIIRTHWSLSICYIVPEDVEYIRKQDGVYEIYYPPKTAYIESKE